MTLCSTFVFRFQYGGWVLGSKVKEIVSWGKWGGFSC
jgi:hypothetical protein